MLNYKTLRFYNLSIILIDFFHINTIDILVLQEKEKEKRNAKI